MTPTTTYDYLLDHLVQANIGVRHALLTSNDGLRRARSQSLPVDVADTLAASASALMSLSVGMGRTVGAELVERTLVTYAGMHLLVMATGMDTILLATTDHDADLGVVAYEMTALVKRVADQAFAVPPRAVEAGRGY